MRFRVGGPVSQGDRSSCNSLARRLPNESRDDRADGILDGLR
jgi:hypothetical protein